MKADRVAYWQSILTTWETRYGIAKRRLDIYESEHGTDDSPDRRPLVRAVNETQDYVEDARYMVRRAKAGL